ncbi:hypothetical protein NW766_012554 [Fusarium irregulare]|uniref:Ubiquitin-like protease family profile domain-containing protein n=1 Tax=Fusarium irregulare TaxID=2494466 RepID=A0A9W8PD47_9HYPO|nr:hypothetical protein NW766_012554 [Fusarium irregulare]
MLGIASSAKSVTRMITSIYTAVTGLGEALGRIIRPQSYQVAEVRSYLSGIQVSNKRIKISPNRDNTVSRNAEAEDNNGLCWIDRDGLMALIESYNGFSKSLAKVWDCLERETREEANKDLAPLISELIDSDDRSTLHDGQAHDFTEVFGLRLRRMFQFLDRIYQIRTIVRIRDSNEFVPPVLEYGLSHDFAGNLESIQRFISDPTLPMVCKSILQKHGEHDCEVPWAFLDRIALDITAILRSLPAPSYVDSQEYRDRLQNMFSLVRPTSLNTKLSLPGSFPEFDEPKELVEQQPAQNKTTPPLTNGASKDPDLSSSSWVASYQSGCFKTNLPGADLAQTSTNLSTFAHYRRTYERGDAHHGIRNKYITDFEAKVPLDTDQVGSVRSILRSRRKHHSRATPKRLGTTRRPKAVRFTEDTVSPRPRTHTGLDLPRSINYNRPKQHSASTTQDQQPRWTRQLFNIPTVPVEEPPRDSIFASSNRKSSSHRRDESGDGYDPSIRIKELLALPSLQLPLSDDSRAGIELQIEQAARKAAEEARLIAEAAKREADEKARRELEARLARSGGLRMPNQDFVTPVSSEWHQKAMSTLRAPPATPLAKSAEGVDLRRHDFAKVVSASEWLNDEIVNASLLWLDRAINSAAGIKDVKRTTRKCFTLGSFFFKRLQDQGVQSTQRTLRRYGVEKRNFLDIDTILLPICEHSHWTLLVIRPSKRTIAHMDSINAGGNPAYTNRAMAWIKDVLEDKFVKEEWKVILHDAPLQNNGHDCGVHTITNAMCISLGLSPIDSYTATDMPTQRIRIASMLLNGGFTGDFDLRVY